MKIKPMIISVTALLLVGCQSTDTKETQTQTAAFDQDAWCEQYPGSAVCPEAKAYDKQKAEWCAEYPSSAIC